MIDDAALLERRETREREREREQALA